jgi:DNA-binding NtrC family response regulator
MSTVLLVDDETELLAATKFILEMKGYRVICAEGIDQAMGLLERERIDLVISDYRMPRGSGFDLFNEMKRRLAASPPFILTTGFGGTLASEAEVLGIQVILPKPYEVAELELALSQALVPEALTA